MSSLFEEQFRAVTRNVAATREEIDRLALEIDRLALEDSGAARARRRQVWRSVGWVVVFLAAYAGVWAGLTVLITWLASWSSAAASAAFAGFLVALTVGYVVLFRGRWRP